MVPPNYLPESVSIPFIRAALKNFCMLGSMYVALLFINSLASLCAAGFRDL